MEFHHIPVLLDETLTLLNPLPGGVYVDGTLGGGGHSSEIIKRIGPEGKLIGIDRDLSAISAAGDRLKQDSEKSNFISVHGNYANIKDILKDLQVDGIDGMLMDLGVSSHQLDEDDRGFTFREDVPLDMRMDRTQEFGAYDVVNKYTLDDLSRVIKMYGEERWAKRIAQFIVEYRPINTTGELVDVIKRAVPSAVRRDGPHPARRTFQAIRIEVNQELELLEGALRDAVEMLKPGGRLCVITFHSLEDRIVKKTFQEMRQPCTCPKDFPICICGKLPQIDILTRKPVIADSKEVDLNNRSRSAKLRGCQKL